jgi:hypothetical protein
MKDKRVLDELKKWLRGGEIYFHNLISSGNETEEIRIKKFTYKNILRKIEELEKI